MLREILCYVTTPCNRSARKFGFLKEVIAIQSRYARQRQQWQPHLQHTRRVIKQATARLTNKRRVIVLGSGLLLDVPLSSLSEQFDEVVLVDMLHLRQVRRSARRFPNVLLVEQDVTGLANQLLNYPGRIGLLPEPQCLVPRLDADTDLVISLNLFSQLAINYVAWLDKQHPDIESDAWQTRVMQAHLQGLSQLACPVLLIGDLQHRYYHLQKLQALNDFQQLLGLPAADETWLWEISPRGELAGQNSMQSTVGAWYDWQDKCLLE